MSAVLQQQQQGSMTLIEFAVLNNLTKLQAQRFAKTGRILGARQAHGGRWIVFPPAKILEALRVYAPRKHPLPFDDQRVKEASHVLSLATAKQPYSVQLTGTQILSIERLLKRECETLKVHHDDDFEPDHRADSGDRLQCLYTALHALRFATGGKL